MTRSVACVFAIGSILGTFAFETANANAQSQLIRLGNNMQSVVDVIITPVGGQPLPTLTIAHDQLVDFNFNGQKFDVQVIPRDDPDSGFRQNDVDLANLATNSTDGILRLRGEFANAGGPDEFVLNCSCRRHFLVTHRYCFYERVERPRGERLAVIFEASLKGGQKFSVRSPKMTYAEAMKSR